MDKKTTKRGRPKGQRKSTRRIMELTKHTVNNWKEFLPDKYMKYIIPELEVMNYPMKGEELKRRVHGVVQGNTGDLLIALAVKKVGKRFKTAEDELQVEVA